MLPTLADFGIVLGTVLGALIGAAAMFFIPRLLRSQTLAQARRAAEDLLRQASAESETLKKQLELNARNDQAKRREEFDREINDQRNELKEQERRLVKREDNLDRKLEALEIKEKHLQQLDSGVKTREGQVARKEQEIEGLVAQQREVFERAREEAKQHLLRVTGMTGEEARRETLALMEHEVRHEANQMVQRVTARAEDEARENALRITLQAIQRYASEHTAASTVAAVEIPSEEMKGRVIGREGRNIRAFEKATGVDVIVDDTPGVVIVSCFDPIRRAIAAEALKKLVDDGRIHPAHIEEIVEQIGKDVQQRIIKFGRDACIEVDLQNVHPKISEMMGRLHYRTSYGQNILRHSVEVAFLCQVIANELGLDGTLARRAGFLHDIGKAMDHEMEGGHPAIGMDFCRKLGEGEAVLNAIGGHHNDIPATTPYTPIVMAADAISGARPGARRETLEKYIKRLQELEGIATAIAGVRSAYAIQAGREVRVIVDPERVDDSNCHIIARDIAKRVSEEMTFPGEIKITVLREMRTVEYAR